MKRQEDSEARSLIQEVKGYLAAIAAFRAQGCEPTWRPEADRLFTEPDRVPVPTRHTPSAH